MSGEVTRARPSGSWAVGVARAGTLLIAVCAFWLSSTTLTDLAHRAGIAAVQAWMWPVIVDGMIVVATVSIDALTRHGPRTTVYPWALLITGTAVSVTANCLHAVITTGAELNPVLSACVVAVPPLMLLASTHLTIRLGRRVAPSTPSTELPAREQTHDNAGLPEIELARNAEPPPALPPQRPRTAALPSSAHGVDALNLKPADGEDTGEKPAEVRRASPRSPSSRQAAVVGAREQAVAWSSEGLSNRAIAARLHVHPSTVGRWLTPAAPRANTTAAGSETSLQPDLTTEEKR